MQLAKVLKGWKVADIHPATERMKTVYFVEKLCLGLSWKILSLYEAFVRSDIRGHKKYRSSRQRWPHRLMHNILIALLKEMHFGWNSASSSFRLFNTISTFKTYSYLLYTSVSWSDSWLLAFSYMKIRFFPQTVPGLYLHCSPPAKHHCTAIYSVFLHNQCHQ